MSTKHAPGPTNGPEHGIKEAYYAGGPGRTYFLPVMICMCGFETDRCDSWADAGGQLDKHLDSIKKQAGQN